jgi:hypothetical protein
MRTSYLMTGSVCGSCGYRHLTIKGTAKCAYIFQKRRDADERFSDRRLIAIERDERREATLEELQDFGVALNQCRANDRTLRKKGFRLRI